MLLPLCRVSWGQKWLRTNYHKIVECYQFFDSTTELLDFPTLQFKRFVQFGNSSKKLLTQFKLQIEEA